MQNPIYVEGLAAQEAFTLYHVVIDGVEDGVVEPLMVILLCENERAECAQLKLARPCSPARRY